MGMNMQKLYALATISVIPLFLAACGGSANNTANTYNTSNTNYSTSNSIRSVEQYGKLPDDKLVLKQLVDEQLVLDGKFLCEQFEDGKLQHVQFADQYNMSNTANANRTPR